MLGLAKIASSNLRRIARTWPTRPCSTATIGAGVASRCALASGKFVTETDDGLLAATADEARGWFVKEAFGFETLDGADAAMKSWAGQQVTAGEGGRLTVSGEAGQPGDVDRFEIDVVKDGIRAAVEAAESAGAAVVFRRQ